MEIESLYYKGRGFTIGSVLEVHGVSTQLKPKVAQSSRRSSILRKWEDQSERENVSNH